MCTSSQAAGGWRVAAHRRRTARCPSTRARGCSAASAPRSEQSTEPGKAADGSARARRLAGGRRRRRLGARASRGRSGGGGRRGAGRVSEDRRGSTLLRATISETARTSATAAARIQPTRRDRRRSSVVLDGSCSGGGLSPPAAPPAGPGANSVSSVGSPGRTGRRRGGLVGRLSSADVAAATLPLTADPLAAGAADPLVEGAARVSALNRSRNSAAVGRSPGSWAMAASRASMNSSSTPGIRSIGSSSRSTMSMMFGVPLSGQRGGRPDSTAYSVAPSEYTSPASVGGRRWNTSGGAYAGVIASSVSLSSIPGSGSAASPKSASPECPYASIRMLAGFTSRCSTPAGVGRRQRVGDAYPDLADLLLARPRLALDPLGQRAALAQRHHQVGPVVGQDARVVDGDDAGMAGHPARRARLAQEPALFGVGDQARVGRP